MDPQAKTTQQTQTSSRLAYLDILRGMGTLLVLFGHIYLNDAAFRWIYTFHMPLFFFAAGWTYREKPFWIDLKRRVQTILIPYFCFGTLTLGYWLLVERHFRDTGLDLSTAVYGLFAGQYDYLGFNVPLWFLPCFFVLTVFFNLLVRLGGQKLAFGLSALMSLVFLLTPLPSLPWGIDRTFRYIAFFAIGHLLSAHNAGPILQQLYTPVKWGGRSGVIGVQHFSLLLLHRDRDSLVSQRIRRNLGGSASGSSAEEKRGAGISGPDQPDRPLCPGPNLPRAGHPGFYSSPNKHRCRTVKLFACLSPCSDDPGPLYIGI